MINCLTCATVSSGYTAQSLAARLATFGAAMLVPLNFRRAPPGT